MFTLTPVHPRVGEEMAKLAGNHKRAERLKAERLIRTDARRRLRLLLPDKVVRKTPFPLQKALLEDTKCVAVARLEMLIDRW